jgi:hypothetical protein
MLMSNLINGSVEGIDGTLVILIAAAFVLLALSSFFGPARVRWWFTFGGRWRS